MARASLRVVVRFKNVCRERLTEAEGAKSVVRVVLRLCLSISGLGQNSGLAKGLLSARASGRYLAVERDVSRGSTKEVGVAGPGVLRAESPGVRYASRFATKLTFFFSKRLEAAILLSKELLARGVSVLDLSASGLACCGVVATVTLGRNPKPPFISLILNLQN